MAHELLNPRQDRSGTPVVSGHLLLLGQELQSTLWRLPSPLSMPRECPFSVLWKGISIARATRQSHSQQLHLKRNRSLTFCLAILVRAAGGQTAVSWLSIGKDLAEASVSLSLHCAWCVWPLIIALIERAFPRGHFSPAVLSGLPLVFLL